MLDKSLDQNRANEALDGIIDLAYRLLDARRPKELRLKAGGAMLSNGGADWYLPICATRTPVAVSEVGKVWAINENASVEAKLHKFNFIIREQDGSTKLVVEEWEHDKDWKKTYRETWCEEVSVFKNRTAMAQLVKAALEKRAHLDQYGDA